MHRHYQQTPRSPHIDITNKSSIREKPLFIDYNLMLKK